jgi:hypothetical protein
MSYYPDSNPVLDRDDLLDSLRQERCDECGKLKHYTGETEADEDGVIYLSECINIDCPECPDFEPEPDDETDLHELVDNFRKVDAVEYFKPALKEVA